MESEELMSLLAVILKDEIEGTVEKRDGKILVTFLDGSQKIVTVS